LAFQQCLIYNEDIVYPTEFKCHFLPNCHDLQRTEVCWGHITKTKG
jgi:hypothetical protein